MGNLGFHVLAVAIVFQAVAANEPGMPPDVREVRSVLDRYTRACNAKDFATISRIFAHGTDVSIIGTYVPQRCVGWKNVAAWYRGLFSTDDTFTVRHRNVEVKLLASGQSACLVCEQDGSGTYQGKPFRFEGVRTTWVLEKQEGQWRVIHAHWSLPAAADQRAGDSAP